MLKDRLMPWNDRLFCHGAGNSAAMRARREKCLIGWALRAGRRGKVRIAGRCRCDDVWPDWARPQPPAHWTGSLAGSVLIIFAGPDAVEGVDMPERDGVRLVEHDACDAIADDLGVG
jgi:hypothetical protein